MEDINVKKKDKRIEKTKACILQALTQLLEKKAISDITVTELAEAANINRKTFYAHYSSIQNVVEEAEYETAQNLILLWKELSDDYNVFHPDILFRCLNTLYTGSVKQFSNILNNEKNHIIIYRFVDILTDVIKSTIETTHELPANEATIIPFVSAFIAGGLMSTFYEWVMHHPEIDINTVTQLTSKLIISGIQ